LVTCVAAVSVITAAERVAPPRHTGTIKTGALDEVSGLAASRRNSGILWMHNDGASPHVFAVKSSGKLVTRLRLGVDVEDVEDMAIGPGPVAGADYLYIADIGSNKISRREIRVYRLPEPNLRGKTPKETNAEDVETFRLAYPDGAHNAEALLIDPLTGDLYVVTKEPVRARVYVCVAADLTTAAPATLKLVASLSVQNVSAGDISRDGRIIILRREERGWLWDRSPAESIVHALQRTPIMIPVRGEGQGSNGEAVGFHPDSRGYYTVSEGENEAISVFPLIPLPHGADR
jgi:hypothetical protein